MGDFYFPMGFLSMEWQGGKWRLRFYDGEEASYFRHRNAVEHAMRKLLHSPWKEYALLLNAGPESRQPASSPTPCGRIEANVVDADYEDMARPAAARLSMASAGGRRSPNGDPRFAFPPPLDPDLAHGRRVRVFK